MFDYAHELKTTHPHSTIILDYEETGRVNESAIFKRIYICLAPLVKGFKIGCRRLIGLDGCHTKGMYKQQILTAVALDSNNGWWPLAWAIVERENATTWSWFLNYLQQDLSIPNHNSYVFIADKQKGLANALEKLLPNCENRNCVMHLYQNFQGANKGQLLKDRFWACARASHVVLFDRQMERLREVDEEAHAWIGEHAGDAKKWCKAHFPLTVKSDMLCNNLSESFNAFISSARDKPIITMLETIRRLCMERIRDRRLAMEKKDGLLCPRIQKLIDDRHLISSHFSVTYNGADSFEVEGLGHKFVVNTKTRECTCRMWQLTAIPCQHAIPCLIELHKDPVKVVDKCYHRSLFIKTYRNVLFPTNSSSLWVKTDGERLAPPNCVRLAGRPKTKRIRNALEVKLRKGKYYSTVRGPRRCSRCGSQTHDKRSCTGVAELGEPSNPEHGENEEQAGATNVQPSTRGRGRGRGRARGRGRGRSKGARTSEEYQSQGPTTRSRARGGSRESRKHDLKKLSSIMSNTHLSDTDMED